MINDALKNDYGVNAVRYSLLSAAVTTTLGALLFVWAARSIRADIKRAIRESAGDNGYLVTLDQNDRRACLTCLATRLTRSPG
jgi:hypothetical protein